MASDRVVMHEGDEIHCVKCGAWHPTYLKPKQFEGSGGADIEHWLWFDCPKTPRPFYGGHLGHPPQVPARWRRRPA